MQKLASSNFWTTWPRYAMNQKIIAVNLVNLKKKTFSLSVQVLTYPQWEWENNMTEAESVHHKTGNGGARISLFFRYIPEFYFREWIHKIRIFGTGKSPGQIESSDKTWHELTIHPQ